MGHLSVQPGEDKKDIEAHGNKSVLRYLFVQQQQQNQL